MRMNNVIVTIVQDSSSLEIFNMKFIYTAGKRLNSRLVYSEDKQLYKIKSIDISCSKYICYRPGCKVRIVVQGDTCSPVPNFDQYSHDDNQETEFISFNEENNLKRKCQEDKVTSIKQIFGVESASTNVTYKKMRSSMAYNRKKDLPINATTMHEAIAYFDNEDVKHMLSFADGSTLFHKIVSNRDYAFAIFKSRKILHNLPENRSFHITASMRVINGFFNVFITFSIVKDAQVKNFSF